MVALAAQDGQAWKTLVCKVNPAQVRRNIYVFVVASLNFLARQRLRQLEQGDKPAHPGLVTPGRIEAFCPPYKMYIFSLARFFLNI